MSRSIRCVSDNVDSAIAFYTDLLGFRLERYDASGLAIVSKGDAQLLLSAPNSQRVGSIVRDKHESTPEVRNEVRLVVDDLEAIAKRLTNAGMQFLDSADSGDKWISLDDPSGNHLELVELSTVSYSSSSLPFWPLLVCPACRGRLIAEPQGASCSVCEQSFVSELAQLDLRLRAETLCTRTFTIGGATGLPADIVVDAIPPNARPAIPNWSDVGMPIELADGNRLTPELLSYFPRTDEPDKWMLDLGCGSATQSAFFEQLTGFKYLGVDWVSEQADLLVDAHSLPFKDESFDFVLCIAVLEHLRIPDLAMSEALRVLKRDGVLVGTAAFLEPFHLNSYEHMTHLAIYRTLRDAGFEVIVIAPNLQWTGLRALAEMSLFPIGAVPRWLKSAAVAPLEAVHRGAWGLKRLVRGAEHTSELRRRLETTAGFRFVARRPSQS